MSTIFFAARRLHRDYFEKISETLQQKSMPSKVFWHKNLWKNMAWLLCLSECRQDSEMIEEIVEDVLREKAANPRYRNRPCWWWKLFRQIRTIEALCLLAVYYNALRPYSGALVVWNGLKFRQRIVVHAARKQGLQPVFMENGLLPGTTTMDFQGINYLNSVPRSGNLLLAACPPPYQDLWIPATIAERPPNLPDHYIFIPFQVNTDSQIVLFSPWIKDMFALTDALLKAELELGAAMPTIILKTHPACPTDYSQLQERLCQESQRIRLLTEGNTAELITHADAIATINSTVGIEAIIANKPLLVMGQAFYNIPELALSVSSATTLGLALQELSSFSANADVRLALLNYLKQFYQIPGRWQDPDQKHLNEVARRLMNINHQWGVTPANG